MPDVAGELNAIGGLFSSPGQRVLATIAIVVVAILLGIGIRRGRRRLEDRIGGLLADILASTGLVAVIAAGSLIVVGVWEQTMILRDFVESADFGTRIAPRLVVTLAVFVAVQVVVDFVGRLLGRLQESNAPLDRHQQEVGYRLSQVALWGLAILVVLGVWEFDLSGILIGAGVLGLVIGMAARQTLRSLLAGFVLMVSQPFEVGDWVAIADASGTVRDISIVNTRIETPDGEYVTLPNDEITATKIVNRSAKGRLRIEVEVGIDYDTSVDRAIAVANDALADLEGIQQPPPPVVDAKRFEESAVVLGVRCWISNPAPRRVWQTRTRVIGAIKEAFDDAGIEVPFPQRTVSMRRGGGGRDAQEEAVEQRAESSSDGGEE